MWIGVCWMRGNLSSISLVTLINENAKECVKATRGLRQGDAISPFRFTIVVGVVSRMMLKVEDNYLSKDFIVGWKRIKVNLLQFVDNTIFFLSRISMKIFFFFDRKRQRNILIKRRYKRRMRKPPIKEKQDYKKSNIR